jgi:molecular chaperone GrpE
MGDHDTTHRPHDEEGDDQSRPRVKVTDRRRVRHDESPPDPSPDPATTTDQAGPAGVTSLDTARREADEYRDHLLRLKAEFDNYRKRVLKEQTRAVDMAAEPLIRRLLEVLDDFELALMAAEKRPDFDKFLHGVELVYAKLVDTLRSEGLERIEAQGEPFDPNRHEALMQSGGGEGEPVVADVLRQGYALKGHVIRPAGVRVARP